jgi:hypothetical protein
MAIAAWASIIFRDKKEQSFLSSFSPHTYILWALETMAWSPKYRYRWDGVNHNNTWIRTSQDLPLVEPMIEVGSPQDGSVWLVLETYPEWREPVPAFRDEFEDRRK